MSKHDQSSNIRFLVVCINNSTNGRPNFEAVAKELNIVTKGAAAKRYERILKSSNVSATGKQTGEPSAPNDADGEPTPNPAKKRKAPAAAAAPKAKVAKKAKTPAAGRKIKAEVKTKGKTEEDGTEDERAVKAESESSLSDAPEDVDMKDNHGEI